MFSLLRRLVIRKEEGPVADPFVPSIGEGLRVYAIGDVHGRRDLLAELLDIIIADSIARDPVDYVRLVMLGDLVDRGADSAGVVDMVITMVNRLPGTICLMGNHEEMFLLALRGDPYGLNHFRRLGRETLQSYGVDGKIIDEGDGDELFKAMSGLVPRAHRDFMSGLPSSAVIGDYLFVHAGIRPGVPLEEQAGRDLRWIRGDFLNSRVAHPHMVVHGHSITEYVDEQPYRIGIDTGAYASGRLTAVGLEGTDRWYLST
jgi:serine/threonine protein phosphatase 1